MDEFDLPNEIEPLLAARDALRQRYASSGLSFTLDGNLVGDIGEAIAAELYGLQLSARCGEGIDGMSPGPNPKTVQVKASGTGRGPAFRMVETRAEHLLFFHLDFTTRKGRTIFNGPEAIALEGSPAVWTGQRMLPLGRLKAANARVADADRLPLLRG
ncbi:MAG: hypothetical protein DI624_06075 [Brevundimonas sp.]|uniref:DUF6998 domain-containing protein n=1 Tax=Brevundimonas sp. TaxID=1871086 RepID=UPI000DB01477|nr:hypothetical protein [Brevundimonas sp.]PZT99108.1 MAG: hypothetical protein DI624_06075 [Brevundimonas sp.]